MRPRGAIRNAGSVALTISVIALALRSNMTAPESDKRVSETPVFDILAVVLAFLVPIVGFIMGLLVIKGARKANKSRTLGIVASVVGGVLSVSGIAVVVIAIVVTSVASGSAVQTAKKTAFCSAVSSNSAVWAEVNSLPDTVDPSTQVETYTGTLTTLANAMDQLLVAAPDDALSSKITNIKNEAQDNVIRIKSSGDGGLVALRAEIPDLKNELSDVTGFCS
jgi:hypothetical protein